MQNETLPPRFISFDNPYSRDIENTRETRAHRLSFFGKVRDCYKVDTRY